MAGILPAFTYRRVYWAMAAFTLLLGLAHWYQFRHVIYADGISYLEIAERYAEGNFAEALNGYWSPLFSWLLIPVVALVAPYWQVAALHALQLALAMGACFLAEALWQKLSLRLADQPLSALPHPRSWLVTRWCIYQWATLYLVGVHNVSADMATLVICLLVWHALLARNFVVTGLLLALGFYAKTAMLAFAAFTVMATLWFGVMRKEGLRAGGQVRGALVMGWLCMALVLPWGLLLQQQTGHFTLGESGRLNYAWEVRGVTRSVHWQGNPKEPAFGAPVHGSQQVSQQPDAFVWKTPFRASYAPWRDPSYFYQGLRTVVGWADQAQTFYANAVPLAWQLFSVPGSLAILALVSRFRRWGAIRQDWGQLPLLLWPSVALTLLYCAVFFETRYLAGPFLLLGSVSLFAVVRNAGPLARIFPVAALAATAVSLVPAAYAGVTNLAADLQAGRELRPNSYALLAGELRPKPHEERAAAYPLPEGAKVAFIGFAMHSDWARLARVEIVGEVTARHLRDDTVHRTVSFEFSNVVNFWRASRAKQEEILAAFRRAGAQYVFVNLPDEKADLSGYHLLRTRLDSFQSDGRVWVRRLEDPALTASRGRP